MHENPEAYVSSAKQLMELNQKREKEALRKEAAANKTTQLASEQVALLKESNELARKALAEANLRSEQERALHESNGTDVVDIKPNFFGLGANLNEAWRRFKKWHSK
ncbi:MAG: hypothetical protein HON76_06105 [Candidatus Scalindua sp.]|jgi:hypothetical protein|nr:hypothetical protein [Candidatus Scalindua sp.]MBT5305130.1 hypothetical protein [Candidatus Scalindua sp.]MBT6051697.1 hypothetical protein [Candidatus Scalindua sp.]MBT6229642.1 hypothetical protein [Candidatus Scalindua sp.]MBT6562083.1 hypothetical protein [Candidatus Scalindua sp.]